MILKKGMMNTHDEHYKLSFHFSTSHSADNELRYPKMFGIIDTWMHSHASNAVIISSVHVYFYGTTWRALWENQF